MAKTKRFPVTVSQFTTVRCALCQRNLAHPPKKASQVLTDHYNSEHQSQIAKLKISS